GAGDSVGREQNGSEPEWNHVGQTRTDRFLALGHFGIARRNQPIRQPGEPNHGGERIVHSSATWRSQPPTATTKKTTEDNAQPSIMTGCSTKSLNAAKGPAPSAPSTTRWSQESVTAITLAKVTLPSGRSTACRRAAPTARMVACGGLMMAVNSRTPYMPRLE